MAESLGSRIAQLRKRRGLTQDALAEEMGVSSQAVSKWENDISCLDITLLPQLADFFGVSVDELLRGERAHEVKIVPESERKDFDKMLLKILVNSNDGDIVKVNLPLGLVRAGLSSGAINMSGGSADALKNVDFDKIIELVESGAVGKLVEVQSAAGDTVEIVVE